MAEEAGGAGRGEAAHCPRAGGAVSEGRVGRTAFLWFNGLWTGTSQLHRVLRIYWALECTAVEKEAKSNVS